MCVQGWPWTLYLSLAFNRAANAAPNGIEAEKEAQQFAAELLIPRASMKALGRVVPNLDSIVRLKRDWAVSVAAMTLRLHELGLLTYYHYNRLYVELSGRGWRANEPFGIKPETSQAWQKVFADLHKNNQGIQYLAAKLLLPPNEIANLVFGLVTVGLPRLEPLRPHKEQDI
jgi:Zn-dependent peptidase ImmA (M78 family)